MAYSVSIRRTDFIISKNLEPDIIMAFIGESGSGKSTCINYFANYFTNSTFDCENHYSNMKIVIPNSLFPKPNFRASNQNHSERDVSDNTMSQTQDCRVYDFIHNEQSIKIIDTPGFNDTDSSKDDRNIQKILKKISQMPFITAIIITINGTNTRLSTSIKATLTQLRSSLPDSVFNNLFFIFTNCTEETRNFDSKLLNEFNPSSEQTFHMQNSLFSIKDRAILQNHRSVRKMVETWEESVDTMGEIMAEINRTSATSVQQFEDMRIRRERLLVHKENLILKQMSLLDVIKRLDIEKCRLANANSDKLENQNFRKEKTISVIEIETKPYYSTLCAQHGRIQVCHEQSTLSYEPQLNLHHFQECAAADGRHCRHCRCGLNLHFHSYEIPVSKLKTIDEIIQSKKAAYDKARRDIRTISGRLVQLEYVRNVLENEVNSIKDELMTTIRELKQICTNFNFLEEMKGTIDKLRKEAKIATDIRAKDEFNNTADGIQQLSTDFTNRMHVKSRYCKYDEKI
jgi:GTPase SAR1 family protein